MKFTNVALLTFLLIFSVFTTYTVQAGEDCSKEQYEVKRQDDIKQYSPLPQEWHSFSGSWGFDKYRKAIYALGNGSDSESNAALIGDSRENYTIYTKLQLLDPDNSDRYRKFHTCYFGIYLRYQDSSNNLRADFFQSYSPISVFSARILVRENGRPRQLAGINLPNYSWGNFFKNWTSIHVEDSGKKITVTLNNQKILSTEYATSVQNGNKGLFCNIDTKALFHVPRITSLENRR